MASAVTNENRQRHVGWADLVTGDFEQKVEQVAKRELPSPLPMKSALRAPSPPDSAPFCAKIDESHHFAIASAASAHALYEMLKEVLKEALPKHSVPPHCTIDTLVYSRRRDLTRLLPSYLGGGKDLYRTLCMIHCLSFSPDAWKEEALPCNGNSYKKLKITLGDQNYVLSHNVGVLFSLIEFMTFCFMHSLGLKILQLPKPITIGRVEEGSILIKTLLKGEPLDDLLHQMVQYPVKSKARAECLTDLLAAMYNTGSGIGEMHTRGVGGTEALFLLNVRDRRIFELGAQLDETKECLRSHRWPDFLDHQADVVSVAFHEAPGLLSYGLRDLSLEHFVWDWESQSIGMNDATSVYSGITVQKRPLCFAAEECFEFLENVFLEGRRIGLSPEENLSLRTAFRESYRKQLEFSRGAELFFQFHSLLRILRTLALTPMNPDAVSREWMKC